MMLAGRQWLIVPTVLALVAWGMVSLTAQAGLSIESPQNGVRVRPGDMVEVVVRVAEPDTLNTVAVIGQDGIGASESQPAQPTLTFFVRIPASMSSGRHNLTAVGALRTGGVALSAPVTMSVLPPLMSGIKVGGALTLDYVGDAVRMDVSGSVDGRRRTVDVSLVRFTSSDPNVATAAQGVVTARGPGQADILVEYDQEGSVLTATKRVTVRNTRQGDLNGDGDVDRRDTAQLRSWLTHPAARPSDARDLNSNGWIDPEDVSILESLCDIPCGDPQDTTPPAVSCAAATGAWSAVDLDIACTAQDAGSGLADPADARFTLTTAVPDGTETADASTDSRQVCDVAGNCATAGPIAGNKIDRRAPSITIGTPAAAAVYRLGEAVTAAYRCVDGGSGVASCAGPVPSGSALNTTAVGAQSFAVSAVDQVGNAGQASSAYTVSYAVCPLFDQGKAARSGSTLPVKLRLCDAGGANRSAAGVAVSATSVVRVASQTSGAVEDAGNANPDGGFRYDPALAGYIFNLSTKGMAAGTYRLEFRAAGDPSVHSVSFHVR